jgi:hypothetical protein
MNVRDPKLSFMHSAQLGASSRVLGYDLFNSLIGRKEG